MSAQLALPVPNRTPAMPAELNSTRIRHAGFLETQAVGNLEELANQLRANRSGRWRDGHGIRLGDLLLGHSLVSATQLAAALQVQHETKRRLGDILVERKLLSLEILRLVLAEQFGYPIVDLGRLAIQPEALQRVPPEICIKHSALPIALIDGRLVVAIGDPSDSKCMKTVSFAAHAPVDFVVAPESDLTKSIVRFFGAQGLEAACVDGEVDASVEDDDNVITLGSLEDGGDEQPVIRLLNHVLLEGIRRNASDIHIRPEGRSVEVLFRIDGQMVKVRTLARTLLQPLVARIKVVGRMDIANRFVPQDGSARVSESDRMIDLRISVIPTIKGESVTIRILNASRKVPSIDDLGFSAEDAETLHERLQRSSGMVLVTGPTGSGKSTTLYAALRDVVRRNVTVMSVEEPVERQLDGVEQIPINNATGFTFPLALRSILRHDPNVIMVGEIRDKETCKLALESSLTGHLVLSTLHTNSAAAAIPRFLDMGIEPYVVASTLTLVMAQRLIRLNCSHCLTSEVVPDTVRRALNLRERERFSRGVGCSHCGGTGYGGRQVVYEMLRMTDAMRTATLARASSDELHRIAVSEGMRPLDEQALEMARSRLTSIAEAYRVRIG